MAVTAVFEHPVVGASVTALQVKDRVTFTLNNVVSADTVIVVSHNMGLSTADIAAGFPLVILEPVAVTSRSSNWVVGSSAASAGRLTNTIELMKYVNAGSDPGAGVVQTRVTLLRTHTIGR